MKFFITLYTNWYADFQLIEKVILEADRLGFDGVLIPDHYMFRKSEMRMRRDRNATLESWIMLAYLAKETERIQLGTFVTPIPFRPPGMLAKMISTLDVLSQGRVVLGVGAGWGQGEFEGYSEWNDSKIRVDKTKEGLELMIQLWTQDEVNFEGQYYKAKGAILEPKPEQKPYPKLLFGGHGDRMLGLADRYADIVFISPNGSIGKYDQEGGAISKFQEKKKKVLQKAKQHNRVGEIDFMYGGFDLQNLFGSYDSKEYSQRVEAAIEAGASYFITPFPFQDHINAMKNFAKEIMPSF